MAALNDYSLQIRQLLDLVAKVTADFNAAKELLAKIASRESIEAGPITLQLVFTESETVVPVPFSPEDTDVEERVAVAAQMLGGQIVDLWHQIHSVSSSAVEHCDQAQQQAKARAAGAAEAQAPQQGPSPQPPRVPGPEHGQVPPQQQQAVAMPQQPVTQPSVPRLQRIQTEPVQQT